MEQDQQHIVEDQPLKVLNLFPKRQINTLSLNYDNYSKLYQNLTCTICRELYKNPVYLRCSHRFCKDCIERYIRANTKKSCPNCRGQLTTKRDLRSDYGLSSLITFAFSDVKAFTASMDEFDKIQIQKCKSTDFKRIQSLSQSKPRNRQQTPQQAIYLPTTIKRTRTNEAQQPKRRRRNQTQKKINSKVSIEKETKLMKQLSQQKKPVLNEQKQIYKVEIVEKIQPAIINQNGAILQTFNRERNNKKKKIQVIQIESNSQHNQKDVQQIRKQQFLIIPQAENDKNPCSISAIPQIQSSKKINSLKQIPQLQKNTIQVKDFAISQSQPLPSQKMIPQIVNRQNSQPSEVVRAIQMLTQQFGPSYLSKIVELSVFPFYIDVTIEKHPLSMLTPSIISGKFKFSLKSSINIVTTFVSEILNINKQSIDLHHYDQSGTNLILANPTQKLFQVNQIFWKNWQQIQLMQLSESILFLQQNQNTNLTSTKSKTFERIIYYSIDFSKLSN